MQKLVWWLSIAMGCFGFALAAPAVTTDWTYVGNPGNACDPQSQGCFGSVAYAYNLGTYEVTNAQYAEFLNAKATVDPFGLYNTDMGNLSPAVNGGIARGGSSGSYTYTAILGREDMPVNHVSFFDALRFVNWLNNGQGGSDTESGAYTLLGSTPTPSNGDTVTRNVGAAIFLPNEDEWYKAAYYSPSAVYYDMPTGTDGSPFCSTPTATANHANCNYAVEDLTIRGSYTGSPSPIGTFDQGGNVWEFNETILSGSIRGLRGGSFLDDRSTMAGSTRLGFGAQETRNEGFRVASIPEPGTGVLVLIGMLGMAFWRTDD